MIGRRTVTGTFKEYIDIIKKEVNNKNGDRSYNGHFKGFLDYYKDEIKNYKSEPDFQKANTEVEKIIKKLRAKISENIDAINYDVRATHIFTTICNLKRKLNIALNYKKGSLKGSTEKTQSLDSDLAKMLTAFEVSDRETFLNGFEKIDLKFLPLGGDYYALQPKPINFVCPTDHSLVEKMNQKMKDYLFGKTEKSKLLQLEKSLKAKGKELDKEQKEKLERFTNNYTSGLTYVITEEEQIVVQKRFLKFKANLSKLRKTIKNSKKT